MRLLDRLLGRSGGADALPPPTYGSAGANAMVWGVPTGASGGDSGGGSSCGGSSCGGGGS